MVDIHPQNQHFLRDTLGSPITDGSCVVDCDRQIGYVRLDLGPHVTGPDSLEWDGWFDVTRTRSGDPWHGKALKGEHVQVVRGGRGDASAVRSPRRREESSESARDMS